MNFKRLSAWALLLALAASLSVSEAVRTGRSLTEDRNCDGQADVWEFYDDDGKLVRVVRDRNFDGYVDIREVIDGNRVVSRHLDQNFDHRFDPGFTRHAVAAANVTFSVVAQPFLLPRAVFVGDHPIDDRAPVTLNSPSESRARTNPSGRAPPRAL